MIRLSNANERSQFSLTNDGSHFHSIWRVAVFWESICTTSLTSLLVNVLCLQQTSFLSVVSCSPTLTKVYHEARQGPWMTRPVVWLPMTEKLKSEVWSTLVSQLKSCGIWFWWPTIDHFPLQWFLVWDYWWEPSSPMFSSEKVDFPMDGRPTETESDWFQWMICVGCQMFWGDLPEDGQFLQLFRSTWCMW